MRTFNFGTEYIVKGHTCRYVGSTVFATFETLDRSLVIQLYDEDLDSVIESKAVIDASTLPANTKPQAFDLPQGHFVMQPIVAVAYETAEKVVEAPPTVGTPKNGKAHKIVEG